MCHLDARAFFGNVPNVFVLSAEPVSRSTRQLCRSALLQAVCCSPKALNKTLEKPTVKPHKEEGTHMISRSDWEPLPKPTLSPFARGYLSLYYTGIRLSMIWAAGAVHFSPDGGPPCFAAA